MSTNLPGRENNLHQRNNLSGFSLSKGWLTVALLSFFYILSYVDRNLVALFADSIKAELNLTDSQLGILYGTTFALFFGIMALPFGWAVDRYSRRMVVCGGVAAWSIATVACGLSRNFTEILAARAGVGAGEASLYPAGYSIIYDMFPRDRLALPMAVFSAGGKIGGGLSFLLGGALAVLIPTEQIFNVPFLGDLSGWQFIFFLAGFPGIILCFLIYIVPEPPRRKVFETDIEKNSSYQSYLRFIGLNRRFYAGHHGGALNVLIIVYSLYTWTPAFFTRVHGWEVGQTGLWLGLAFIAGPIFALPVHGAIVDKWCRAGRQDAHILYLKIVLVLALFPLTLTFLSSNAWLTLALLTVAVALISAYACSIPAALQLFIPDAFRGKASSVSMFVTVIGAMLIGPPVIGILNDYVFMGNMGLSIMVGCSGALVLGILCQHIAQSPFFIRVSGAPRGTVLLAAESASPGSGDPPNG